MLRTLKAKSKMRMSKRRIPLFKLSMKNGATLEQVYTHPEIKKAVIDETINAICEGMKNNRDYVDLFNIVDSNYTIELKKNNWKNALSNALNFYVEAENYTKCIKIRDMINKL
jgi:hypothetical protein